MIWNQTRAWLALVLINFLGAWLAQAEECCLRSSKSLKDQVAGIMDAAAGAPDCIEYSGLFGDEPEKKLRELTAHLSDTDIAARLIFAEAIASGCPSPDLVTAIANVINRRVQSPAAQYGQGVKGVVFQKFQFRSTTGGCDVAQRNAFLCPSKAQISSGYQSLWAQSVAAFTESQDNPRAEFQGVFNYFFFQHFDGSKNCARWKGVVPDWASSSRRMTPSGMDIPASCVGFYRP